MSVRLCLFHYLKKLSLKNHEIPENHVFTHSTNHTTENPSPLSWKGEGRKDDHKDVLCSVTSEKNLIYSGEFWGGQTVERVLPDFIFFWKNGVELWEGPGRRQEGRECNQIQVQLKCREGSGQTEPGSCQLDLIPKVTGCGWRD